MPIPQINWKARHQTNYLVLHASYTDEENLTVDELRGMHMRQGLLDIGWHFIIRRDGIIDPGRPLFAIGHHTELHDDDSIGICLVGGADKDGNQTDNFSDLQKNILRHLVITLRQMYPEADLVTENFMDNIQSGMLLEVVNDLKDCSLGEFL